MLYSLEISDNIKDHFHICAICICHCNRSHDIFHVVHAKETHFMNVHQLLLLALHCLVDAFIRIEIAVCQLSLGRKQNNRRRTLLQKSVCIRILCI